MIQNPYANRKAVYGTEAFFGREGILEDIIFKLEDNINLYGEPRSGRTSLLLQLTASSGQLYEKLHNSFDFVFLDVQQVRGEKDFWLSLVCEMLKHSNRNSDGLNSRNLSSDFFELLIDFENLIKSSSKKIVFVFDNFDFITKFEAPKETIYVADRLRAFWQKFDGKISYLFCTLDQINILFEKHNLVQDCSPLQHIIGYSLPLGLLEREAARKIVTSHLGECSVIKTLSSESWPLSPNKVAKESGKGKSNRFTEAETDTILNLAGRHPDLIKRTCFHFFERNANDSNVEEVVNILLEDIHIKLLLQFLYQRQYEYDDIRGSDHIRLLTDLASGKQPSANRSLSELEELGLIEFEQGSFKIFSELFRCYLLSKEADSAGQSPKGSSFQVNSSNGLKNLTPKELKLFRYLSAHTGPCSREELITAIWGLAPPKNKGQEALDQIIRRLRKKIEADNGTPQNILTIRGQGYMLKQ